jgi:UDPglucose 6-dehydrogenase
VALLGLAFKPNTDDVREASSLVLASRLQAEGVDVRAYDPVAGSNAARVLDGAVTICDSLLEAVEGADATVIVTEWNEFRTVLAPAARAAMANPLLIDGRNLLDAEQAAAAGFVYESIGRPAPAPVAT